MAEREAGMPVSSKEFRTAVVLSALTGRLLCTMNEIYEVLNFLTGDNLYTHQLPRAFKECGPYLRRWFPAVEDTTLTTENWQQWLADQEAALGSTLTIERIPMDDHDVRDPLEELQEMLPDKPIIVVQPLEGIE